MSYRILFIFLMILGANQARATAFSGGFGEVLLFLYSALTVIGILIIVLGYFWLRITVRNLKSKMKEFYKLKLYILLSLTLTIITGASAFTFHPNAPYSQNIYFMSLAIVTTVISLFTLFKGLTKNNGEKA